MSAKKAPRKKAAKKKAVTKKATKKKATKKKAVTKKATKKKATKKKRPAKAIGSAKNRTLVHDITDRFLDGIAHLTPSLAGPKRGVSVDDIRNMRAGNNLSSAILLKLVRDGGYSPKSIIEGPKLRKARKGTSVKGVEQAEVDKRIRQLAHLHSGKELAELTGLSVTGAYGLRYAADAHITLYTILGFLDAGYTTDQLIYGKGLPKTQAAARGRREGNQA